MSQLGGVWTFALHPFHVGLPSLLAAAGGTVGGATSDGDLVHIAVGALATGFVGICGILAKPTFDLLTRRWQAPPQPPTPAADPDPDGLRIETERRVRAEIHSEDAEREIRDLQREVTRLRQELDAERRQPAPRPPRKRA